MLYKMDYISANLHMQLEGQVASETLLHDFRQRIILVSKNKTTSLS
jgi:hypothetical protein